MFATTRGSVRRNKLSDFAQVNRAGKIAMKLDEGEGIVDVQICGSENDDVLLTTNLGQCIRFAVADVRVFKGCDSHGRARHHAGGGRQRHFAGDPPRVRRGGEERSAYLKMRRAMAGETAIEATREEVGGSRAPAGEGSLPPDRYAAMSAAEKFTLDDLGERLRLTHLLVRISAHGVRRQGHRRDGGERPQR